MGDDPEMLPGEAPARREPRKREHDWSSGQKPDRFGSPAWLNSTGGTDNPVCNRCGCELVTGSVVFADVRVTKGQEHVYRTATGKVVHSLKPLACPVFAFDEMSAAMEAKEVGREAKIEAEKVDIRVDDARHELEQLARRQRRLAEAMEARVSQLERENRQLREQVGQVTQIDLGQLAEKLFELAEAAKGRAALEPVESKGRVVQIPKELADVIDVVGVPVEDDDDDEDDDDETE